MRHTQLLTKSLEKQLPPLYSQENNHDPDVVCKFFTPDSYWTWYVIEYDPLRKIFFGYVEGMENELGYFTLDELKEIRGPLGLPIERDLYFTPCKLSEIQAKAER